MHAASTRLGRLDALLVRGNRRAPAADRALVLCHGFGAPGDDLVPLAEAVLSAYPLLKDEALLIFPEAPLQPEEFRPFGGRAWWPLDIAELQHAIVTGKLDVLCASEPPRLPTAREELTSLLEAVTSTYGIPLDRVVIGGFSQGAMLATDVALHLAAPPAGLVIFSGMLLAARTWARLAPARQGLPVIQSHGWQDPILPFSAAEQLRDLLQNAGLEVTFLPFSGGHAIPPEPIRRTAALLGNLT